MSDRLALAEAFRLLREQCDPRGHDLLRALENLCIWESIALDEVLESMQGLGSKAPSNVVEMNDYYSRKVPS